MHLTLKASHAVLEALLLAGLRAAAERQGARVDDLEPELSEAGGAALAFRVRAEVGKWGPLVRLDLEVSGQVGVTDEFELAIGELSVRSGGLGGPLGCIAGLFVDPAEKAR